MLHYIDCMIVTNERIMQAQDTCAIPIASAMMKTGFLGFLMHSISGLQGNSAVF